jgi:2-haloacid dehalogenase
VLEAHGVQKTDDEILELYAKIEFDAECGMYMPYRDILKRVVDKFGERCGFVPTPEERQCLLASLRTWRPFPDTVEALGRLRKKFKLYAVSNVDDVLFQHSAKQLEVRFDAVVTAEQVQSYKPSLNNFRRALDRINEPPARILHVAQSLYHDVVPANTLGFCTVWVNRRKGKNGHGAVTAADAMPDIEVPDLATLADILMV